MALPTIWAIDVSSRQGCGRRSIRAFTLGRMSLLWREGSLRRRPAMKAQNCVRRPMLNAVFLIAGVLPAFNPAAAQEWPARNMMVVVPLGAGSASDVIARVVMDQVAKQLGATIIIENRPGAGGTIGANLGPNSAPGSHTAP